ncbi:mitochondrial intermembrane space import and assembly protein 40-B-like [Dendronephthya gigantea]|uniref:mitochondrial intermembrane space import and assembly protein 40-B-like n=1 Tax=Dendronephthya gigantea TaxID=151771 RepID=UPI001068FDF3|nr:mitochondrial intermembrane space import and assembly protein 40-B-like [Dendronephthya gigantea]
MSYCREEGKDKIIFVTEADHAEASKVNIPEVEDEAEYEGLIKPNGEINWECPCLGGMATGVCGEQFKAAFSCFHTSTSEPKGSDCIEQFRTMQECFRQYPEIYGEFESIDTADEEEQELSDFVGEQKESEPSKQEDSSKSDKDKEKNTSGQQDEKLEKTALKKADL